MEVTGFLELCPLLRAAWRWCTANGTAAYRLVTEVVAVRQVGIATSLRVTLDSSGDSDTRSLIEDGQFAFTLRLPCRLLLNYEFYCFRE